MTVLLMASYLRSAPPRWASSQSSGGVLTTWWPAYLLERDGRDQERKAKAHRFCEPDLEGDLPSLRQIPLVTQSNPAIMWWGLQRGMSTKRGE